MDLVYGNSSNFVGDLRMSVLDELRLASPKTATTEDNVTKVYDLVLVDRLLKVFKFAEIIGV